MSNPLIPQSNALSKDTQLLNLSEIKEFIRSSWHIVFGVVVISLLISLVLAFVLQKKWEVSATLIIARIPMETGELKTIEDPLQTVERIKLIGFKQKLLSDLGLPTRKGLDKRSDILLSTMTADPIKNTEFINISVRAYSKQDAIKSIQVAVTELKAEHVLLALPIKTRIDSELEATNENLSIIVSEISQLNKQMSDAGTYRAASEFSPSIIAIDLLAAKEAAKSTLQLRKIQLNYRLTSLDKQSTRLINKINIPDKQIFPKLSVFLILGGLFGLLLGFGIALLRFKK
jgi:LPS O-antigen subunit length determinant protein (WzzB/FepE family)